MKRGKDNNYLDEYSSNEAEEQIYIRESPGNRMQKSTRAWMWGHKERSIEESSERTHVSK